MLVCYAFEEPLTCIAIWYLDRCSAHIHAVELERGLNIELLPTAGYRFGGSKALMYWPVVSLVLVTNMQSCMVARSDMVDCRIAEGALDCIVERLILRIYMSPGVCTPWERAGAQTSRPAIFLPFQSGYDQYYGEIA